MEPAVTQQIASLCLACTRVQMMQGLKKEELLSNLTDLSVLPFVGFESAEDHLPSTYK